MFRFFRSTENQRLVARLVRESFREHMFGYGAAILSMLVVAGMFFPWWLAAAEEWRGGAEFGSQAL